MRRIATFASLLCLATGALAADDLPRRQPGLWEHRMQMSTTGSFTHAVQVCTDDKLDDLARQQGASSCSKLSIRRDGDRVLIDSVCQAGGSTATTHGSFSGDFSQHFVGQLATTFAPPLNGMQQTTLRMDARRLGPCKPGQKPGDMVMMGLPGGIDLNEMMKHMPVMPGR
ncbi:DUF3617 family protein [Nitrogeniibacter mangrovi]|uniref:DUF3617 family protein n=1 Tax=Nitrogeniibacter mangrovi TaxID=2016596 RepID=A0A6C1B1Z1_9RHOO|nr:DUF3617 family protein [Nitrogeniibacter mangrovi]QID16360.1 DUF3617 family protein [Nitrogeniibacter mangrovi]